MSHQLEICFKMDDKEYSYEVALDKKTPENAREYWILGPDSMKVIKMVYVPAYKERNGAEGAAPIIEWKDPDDTHVHTDLWKELVAYEIAKKEGLDDFIQMHTS